MEGDVKFYILVNLEIVWFFLEMIWYMEGSVFMSGVNDEIECYVSVWVRYRGLDDWEYEVVVEGLMVVCF